MSHSLQTHTRTCTPSDWLQVQRVHVQQMFEVLNVPEFLGVPKIKNMSTLVALCVHMFVLTRSCECQKQEIIYVSVSMLCKKSAHLTTRV